MSKIDQAFLEKEFKRLNKSKKIESETDRCGVIMLACTQGPTVVAVSRLLDT
jgi:hypothetical protein